MISNACGLIDRLCGAFLQVFSNRRMQHGTILVRGVGIAGISRPTRLDPISYLEFESSSVRHHKQARRTAG